MSRAHPGRVRNEARIAWRSGLPSVILREEFEITTHVQMYEFERFWAGLKRHSEMLTNEAAGIVIETGQPIDGGSLSVAYRVTKAGHGFPLGKVIVSSGPGERRDVLTIQELEWIADDPALMEIHNAT